MSTITDPVAPAAEADLTLDAWTLDARIASPPSPHWIAVARDVAARLAEDVVERDRRGGTPDAELEILREADLLRLPVAKELGGHGEPLRVLLTIVRLIARVDASIAHLLAYHWAFLTQLDPDLDRPLADLQRRSAEHGWIIGSTGTPLDAELEVEATADGGLLLSGTKRFATAARVAQRIIGFPVDPRTGERLIVEIDPSRPGIEFLEDWDTLGQRLTASNGLRLDRYAVGPDEILASTGRDEDPKPAHRTIGVLAFQLIFVHLYLGIAEGALLTARAYTRTRTRAWIHGTVDTATEDPFILQTYGGLVARVQALAALADQAERAATWANGRGTDLTDHERAEAANLGAAAKVVATETVLETAQRVFETAGASVTQRSVGLDLYWRNARTHTLHSPVSYKRDEVGRLFLNDELATPSDYR